MPSQLDWSSLSSPAPQPSGPPATSENKPKETGVFGQVGAGFHEELSSALHAAKNVSGLFDSAVKKIQQFTGKDAKWSKSYLTSMMEEAEQHQKESADKSAPPQGMAQTAARSVGAAPVQLGEYLAAMVVARRPAAAMGLVDAAKELDKGVSATVKAGIGGAAAGASLEYGSKLPLGPRVATNVGLGAGKALYEGQGLQGAITSGLAQGAFGAIGAPGKKAPEERLSPQQRLDMVTKSTEPHIDAFKRTFAADTISPEASKTAGNIAERYAIADLERNRAYHEGEEATKFFAKQPKDLNLKFFYGYENGQVPHGMEKFAGDVKSITDKTWNDLSKRGLLFSYVENYLPHIYKDPKAAETALRAMNESHRPMRGSRSFKYERKYSNAELAKATAGLELVSDNPMDLVFAHVAQAQKAIAAHDFINEEIAAGRGVWKRAGKPLPKGMEHFEPVKLDDPTFSKFAPPSKNRPAGKLEIAHYYGDPLSVNLINNRLSTGLTKNAAWRGLRSYGNFENMLQLGLSFRHAVTGGQYAAADNFAVATQQLWRAKFGEAAKGLMNSATLIGPAVTYARKGLKLEREALKPGSVGGEATQIVDAYLAGGGRLGKDEFYRTQMTKKFHDMWSKGNIGRAVAISPLVPIEKAANIVMDKIIPTLKHGAAYHRLEMEMDKLGPNASRDEMRRVARQVTNHVDNIMGEMVYDNRFVNRTFKDVGQVLLRSLGWNWGDFAIAGGAAKDIRQMGPKALRDSANVAFILGLFTTQAYIGAITQLLYGQGWPKDINDYMHPRTGGADSNGNPERIHTANYISNDGYSFMHDPIGTAVNKLNPVLSQIGDIGRNKDWRGNIIRKPTHSGLQQAGDVGKYLAEQQLPLSVTQSLQNVDEDGENTVSDWVMPQLGINKSPSWISQSKAERLASDILATKGGNPGSEERQEAYKKEKQFAKKMRAGKDISEEVGQEIESGRFGKTDVVNAYRSGQRTHLQIQINRLTLEEALSVYKASTPEEQELIKPLMYRKLRSLKTKGEKERERVYDMFNETVAGEDISKTAAPPAKSQLDWSGLK